MKSKKLMAHPDRDVKTHNDKSTINDIQMLTALTNLYDSLHNQDTVIHNGMVNIQQNDGSFKKEPYNFKNVSLLALMPHFWQIYDEMYFKQHRYNEMCFEQHRDYK